MTKKRRKAKAKPIEAEGSRQKEAGASRKDDAGSGPWAAIISKKQGATVQDRRYLREVLLFIVTAIALNPLFWFDDNQLSFVNLFTASLITKLIQLSGLQATMDGYVIHLANSSWLMTTECTGIFVMVIYASFILTYTASLRAKGLALLAGIPFIYGANIIRLYTMAWIDTLTPEYSKFVHDYMWQGIFIGMVVIMWILWIDWIAAREAKAALPR